MSRIIVVVLMSALFAAPAARAQLESTAAQGSSVDARWIVFEGKEGPGVGKHIVLASGDEEYRSEELLPMLAKILAHRHGFKCTVLFSQNPETGEIDPNNQTNIPGMHLLKTADMLVLSFRFRELPDADMKHFVDYMKRGGPVLGLRTSTHAFNYTRNKQSPYARFTFRNNEWKGGWGRQVLGETWINHHGHHGRESTRGIIEEDNKAHPILKGVDDIWGPTDVYGVRNTLEDATILVRGAVLAGMKPTDEPVAGKKNHPMMPVIWTRDHTHGNGTVSRVIASTMGASQDMESEGFRRLLVNACYWGMGLEAKIPARSDVRYVGEYKATRFGFNTFTKGVKPTDHLVSDR